MKYQERSHASKSFMVISSLEAVKLHRKSTHKTIPKFSCPSPSSQCPTKASLTPDLGQELKRGCQRRDRTRNLIHIGKKERNEKRTFIYYCAEGAQAWIRAQSYFRGTLLVLTSTEDLISNLNVILILSRIKVHHCLFIWWCLNLKNYIISFFFEWVKALNPTPEFLKGLKGIGSTQKLLSNIKHKAICYLKAHAGVFIFSAVMTFFNQLSGCQNGTRQCHFSLHLFLSASFFFVHLDPTLVHCVHKAQHNSA